MALLDLLTPQERRCLSGVARHRQADEISAELGIARATVERHLANARRKLGVTSSRAAVRLLHDRGEALHTGYAAGFSRLPDAPPAADPLRPEGGRDDRTQTDHPRLVQGGLDARERPRPDAGDDLAGSGDGAGPAGPDARAQGLGGPAVRPAAEHQRRPDADGSAAADHPDGLGDRRPDRGPLGAAVLVGRPARGRPAALEPDRPGVGHQLQRVRAAPSPRAGAAEGSAAAPGGSGFGSRDAALDFLDRGRAAVRESLAHSEAPAPGARGLAEGLLRVVLILAALGFCTFLLMTAADFALWLQQLLFQGPGIPRTHL
ncbi:MAG: LuxR C-terminal-related transcriptional regulator [Alphaproteobacteria bacterium]|nr:LuxR C-terminal-related transcriptional regulator [Alphaproteobacteria bacterium]MBU1526998.1 LuxR C-terminal-related transcriptional regulator [Alphaproteobacteria bacterium]MBU2118083.1 LuxR C-terminal-related transcriptional regulator [Alphaproteobacteria bacterium]MBU2351983.1 LuxR C-terminal-related transcriptional regulator [Alphaproteobacteria bacterium]MBU2382195.1 LuxR C-terminal-related transcriptional regulator [Alphaproteobacteria bacterium]